MFRRIWPSITPFRTCFPHSLALHRIVVGRWVWCEVVVVLCCAVLCLFLFFRVPPLYPIVDDGAKQEAHDGRWLAPTIAQTEP